MAEDPDKIKAERDALLAAVHGELDADGVRTLIAGTGFSPDGLIDAMTRVRLEPSHVLPQHRLRYIIARNAAEIMEAMRREDRLLQHDRELLNGYLDQLVEVADILDGSMTAREDEGQ